MVSMTMIAGLILLVLLTLGLIGGGIAIFSKEYRLVGSILAGVSFFVAAVLVMAVFFVIGAV